jgi:hypothetical protein
MIRIINKLDVKFDSLKLHETKDRVCEFAIKYIDETEAIQDIALMLFDT